MISSIQRPTLIINETVCRANILRMAQKADASGVIFRPHFKTHQSEEIGNIFREYAISKITVSSVEMAMQFAAAGWKDICIAFPVNIREISQINELSKKIKLSLLLDSAKAAHALSEGLDAKTGIFTEVDCGYGRSGIHFKDIDGISEIVQSIDSSEMLVFKGFLTHSGDTYNAGGKQEIIDIFQNSIQYLKKLKSNFYDRYPGIIISVGDTPSCSIVDDLSAADEIRPGNFVYNDLMQVSLGSCKMKDIAVSVACPVTGIYPERNEIVIYGGAVHLSKEFLEQDGKLFGLIVQYHADGWSEPIPNTRLYSISQEHGVIKTSPEFLATIKHGDLLGILPVHSCLTANLLKEKQLIL